MRDCFRASHPTESFPPRSDRRASSCPLLLFPSPCRSRLFTLTKEGQPRHQPSEKRFLPLGGFLAEPSPFTVPRNRVTALSLLFFISNFQFQI
jgi:hypothetical protein